jgi:hypothetical protein
MPDALRLAFGTPHRPWLLLSPPLHVALIVQASWAVQSELACQV